VSTNASQRPSPATSQESRYSNGNMDLLGRILREARRQVGRRHVPSSMRPHVFEAWTRCPSVSPRPRSATPEQCPRCSRAPSARSATARTRAPDPLSADEGTTIFLFCHTCSTQWTQGG
jgi:DNA-directed RNA polymerase subunit M/transcription elongation factor TFIIS